MGDAPREIKLRHIGNFLKADPAYGKGVADALGIPLARCPTEASRGRRDAGGPQ
jgi:catalase